MGLRKLRERINLKLYDSKANVLRLVRVLNLVVSITAIATLVYMYGFEHSPYEKEALLTVIRGSFAFYIIQFIIRFLFDFHPKQFLKRNWVEGSIMIFLILEGIAHALFGSLIIEQVFARMGIGAFEDVTTFLIQAYFFVVVFLELKRSSSFFPKIKLHPAAAFMLSFLVLILTGAGLLMLPEMTVDGDLAFTDALFMSTSATCVTGLGVVDCATEFSTKGHVVILILIKLGGLNIIAFGFIFILMNKIGLGVKQDSLVEDFVNSDTVHTTRQMLRKIVLWSIGIELLGAALIYPLLSGLKHAGPDGVFYSVGEKIFCSLFHSVSAFNNAGLSTFEGGLYNEAVRENYLFHLVVTIVVFFGALGFVSIFNLFDPRALRDRMKYRWKQISFSTKIALYFSLIFVVLGTVGFYALEYNNTLKGQNFGEAMITSLFQSVTRTSGFNTVDFDASDGYGLGIPFLVLMLFLMFVGSSSSSTGGGIKTSTFAILWATFTQTIRGAKHPSIFKRTISSDLIGKAFTVLLIFVAGNLICIFALTITESHILAAEGRSIMDLIFEEVSAFGTVGLSTGITSNLSEPGKYIIVISMFVGRVGTLTVAYLFGKKVLSKNFKYPSGHTMVG